VNGKVCTNVMKECFAFIFRVKQSKNISLMGSRVGGGGGGVVWDGICNGAGKF
jgi:hypothetical protein